MNFYFLVCSALLSSVYQDRHIHTDTQTQPKWNKKRIFPQLLSIKLRSLRSYIYVFIQEFPIFDFMDNWKDLFSRSVWFFPGRCLPFVLWIMWQVNSDSDSLSHNKMSEITVHWVTVICGSTKDKFIVSCWLNMTCVITSSFIAFLNSKNLNNF